MRGFFKALLPALIASLVGVSCAGVPEAENPEAAVQLYNFRTLINTPEGYAANHEEIFRTLAEQGYTAVEAAGYSDGLFYGVTPEQFRADVEAAGLRTLSSHTSFVAPGELASGDFTETLAWWDKCIDDHRAAGMKYIVWPYMGMPDTLAELQKFCDLLNAIGARCAEKGISFGYHSHSHEFVCVEGCTAYDYMLENTDPDCVFFQMDVYWAVVGHAAPVEYFEKYPGRFKMLHIKDEMDLGKSGMVNFDAIFRNLDVAGTKDIVVEEEAFPDDDWKAGMQADIDYLRWIRKIQGVSLGRQDDIPEITCSMYVLRYLIYNPETYAEHCADALRSIADMGFTSVEVACYDNGAFYGIAPEQFRADVEAAGLRTLSSHVNRWLSEDEYASGDFSASLAWWDECIAAHKAAGMKYILYSYLPLPKNLDQLKIFCDYLNAAGKKCAEQGLTLGYHNHAQEFGSLDNEVVLDFIYRNIDPEYVFLVQDAYWVVVGGSSPVDYFTRYPGRFRMVQFKDDFYRELGTSGMVGFDAVWRNLDLAGAEHIVLEIEETSSDDWKACLQKDIDYIKWLAKVLK